MIQVQTEYVVKNKHSAGHALLALFVWFPMVVCFSYFYHYLMNQYYTVDIGNTCVPPGHDGKNTSNMNLIYRGLCGFGCAFSAAHILVAFSHCCSCCKSCAKFLSCIMHTLTFPFLIAATAIAYGNNWGLYCQFNEQSRRVWIFT